MNLDPEESAFLRDVVKASRQKVHHVHWVDRDGTPRQTALSPPEVTRLNTIAQRLKTSKSEVLRQAAHIPVPKKSSSPSSGPTSGDPES
ncbi:MAG: hypothetical protein ABIV50_10970 [Opitutus sp.]